VDVKAKQEDVMSTLSRRSFLISAAVATTMAAMPTPSRANSSRQPNILLVLSDQHRADWLGCAGRGVPVRTPHIDALAARGVRFDNAYCASPVCGPSRACLASGLEYDQCRVPDHKVNYPLDQVTFYRLLRDGGYHVMGCGKFDLHKATHNWGVDGQHLLPEWGFSAGIDSAGKWDALKDGSVEKPRDPYMAYLHSRGLAQVHAADLRARGQFSGTDPTPLDDDAYGDNWIARQGLRLLSETPAGRPWFLQVNFAGPHEPMDVTASMHRLYRDPPVTFPPPRAPDGKFSAKDHQEIRRNYAAMIENIDRWFGRYIDELRQRGDLDNTLIIYSSDHGEMLGDHGLWHKHRPYDASAKVPLVIAGPGVAAQPAVPALVSLIDLAATCLDTAGLGTPASMQARSLRPILEGRSRVHRDVVRSGLGPWRMVRDERYKLIEGFHPQTPLAVIMGNSPGDRPVPTPRTMLFDLSEDVAEDNDRSAQLPQRVAALRAQLRV
jgi:arylsulfatase